MTKWLVIDGQNRTMADATSFASPLCQVRSDGIGVLDLELIKIERSSENSPSRTRTCERTTLASALSWDHAL